MLTVQQATKNLYMIAQQATKQNWDDGKQWYVIAHTFCEVQAKKYNSTLPQVVGILAVLSPQCAWETNQLATIDILERQETSRQVFPSNVSKALQIFHGIPFETVMNHSRYGRKVRAFYDNILHLDKSELVTIDTHATRAAFNLADITTAQIRWVFESKQGNQTLSEAYKQVARHYHLTPNKIQAVIWLAVKDSLERT